jgi:hypothetical protein
MTESLPGVQQVHKILMDMQQVLGAVYFGGRDISGSRLGNKPGVLLLAASPPQVGDELEHLGVKSFAAGFFELTVRLADCPSDLFYDFLYTGQIVLDRDGKLMEILHKAEEKKEWVFGWRVFAELTYLMEKFFLSRTFFAEGKKLDSYRNLVESLVNWARIAVYQHGAIPRRDIWAQVKEYDLGIERLYEEVIYSDETLDKRIELMQLVYQNQVHSQAKVLSAPLLGFIAKHGEMAASKLASLLPQGINHVYLAPTLDALAQLGHIQKRQEDDELELLYSVV